MKDQIRFLRDLTEVLNRHRVVLGYGGDGYLVARDADSAETLMALDFFVRDPVGTVVVRRHVDPRKMLAVLREAIKLDSWRPDQSDSEDRVAWLVQDFRDLLERAAATEDLPLVDRDSLFAQADEDRTCCPGDMLFLDRYLVLVRNYRLVMQGIMDTAEKLEPR